MIAIYANMTGETTGGEKIADGCKAKPTHDVKEDQARMRGCVCSSVLSLLSFLYMIIKCDFTLIYL